MDKEDLPLTLVIFLILITLTVMGIPAAKKLSDKLAKPFEKAGIEQAMAARRVK